MLRILHFLLGFGGLNEVAVRRRDMGETGHA